MPEKLQPKLDRFLQLLSQHQQTLPRDLLFAALDLGAEVNRVRMEKAIPPAIRPNARHQRIPAEQFPPYELSSPPAAPAEQVAFGRQAGTAPLISQGSSHRGRSPLRTATPQDIGLTVRLETAETSSRAIPVEP